MTAAPTPGGMALRLAWCAASAVALGVWLWLALRRPRGRPPNARLAVALQGVVVALCGFWCAVWLALALLRLRYPYELEWMGGAMRDTAVQALNGRPLYLAPGGGWFPFLYPPLYAWVSAAAMRLLGTTSYVPMRLVSILSTVGSAALLFLWMRRIADCGLRIADCGQADKERERHGDEETGDKRQETTAASGNPQSAIRNPQFSVWPILAAGLFLAAYRFTGAWYDVERIDMLFLFLSLLGAYWTEVARERQSVGWACAAGVAFGLAFLTKQQAGLFLVAGVVALLWVRQWRLAAALAVVGGALCIGSVLALAAATGGWFRFYCFVLPAGGELRTSLARQFVSQDLLLYAPVLVVLAGYAWALGRKRAGGGRLVVMAATTVAAVVGSCVSRAHLGGYENVLIPAYATLGALACAAAGRLAADAPGAHAPLLALALAQLLAVSYRPGAQLPTAANRAAGDRYAAVVRGLEREGETLCLYHGGFTQPAHFHIDALADILTAGRPMPPDLVSALRAHRYAAILADAEPTATGPMAEFRRDYPRVQCLDLPQTWVVTGYPTPNASQRVWVMRP